MAAFTASRARIVRAWTKTERSPFALSSLMDRARKIQKSVSDRERKKHSTAGFFFEAVQRAVSEVYTTGEGRMLAQGKSDWGGFPDVGQHTGCRPPTTCWAIVVAALRSLLASMVRCCMVTGISTGHPRPQDPAFSVISARQLHN
jgi:hypothetical protein